MADEIKRVITVDVAEAVSHLEEMREASEEAGYGFRSLGDAKKYIDKLKASLIDMDEESGEYVDTVKEIETVQNKLNTAMKASSSTLSAAEGSYNALSKQMSELKKAWKETNDEAERESLGKQIVEINDKLKSFDSSIGNYQRNVGNYEGAFTKGLTGIAEKITALGNPLQMAKQGVSSLNTAFKAIITNPIGAVITAIVVAVKALKNGFEGSEDATNKLKEAFSAFQPVINLVQNTFTKFANLVGDIAKNAIPALVNGLMKAGDWMMTLLNKIGIVSDETLEKFKATIEKQKESIKESQVLVQREIELEKKKRDLRIQEAKTSLEVSQLKAKAADTEKYSDEERVKFLEAAIAKERAINNQKLAIAQEEFNIAKERAAQTDNDAAANDALAEAEAHLYDVKSEYFNKEKELITQLNAARKKVGDTEEEVTDIVVENIETRNDDRDKELEKVKEIQERTSLALLDSTERDITILTKKYEEEKALLEKYGEDTVNLTKEYQDKVAEIKSKEGEGKVKDIDDETALQTFIIDKTIKNEFEKNQRILEIERKRLEDEKIIYEELMNLDNLSEEKKQEYADKLAEINAQIVANDDEVHRQKVEKISSEIDTYAQAAQALGNLMDQVAGMWQDDIKNRFEHGKITEEQAKKEFENTKKMQIASAIITGLSGIAAAVANAMVIPPPAGPIIGAINAATVAATMAAQIVKIKQTKFDSGGSSATTSSPVAAPSSTATAYSPNYSTNVTGQSETTDLANAVKEGQKDQRVFVVESDITETGKRVQVRESEATF